MKTIFVASLFAALVAAAGPGQAAVSNAKVKSLVAEIRKNPDDTALREKIIELVQATKTKPEEPDEVDELKGLAKQKFEDAKSQPDYAAAADAFAKVTLAAPWVGDYYLNLGLALDKAGKPQEAITNLRLYLKAEPDAPDASKVRTRIGRLRALAEAKPAEPAPPPAPPKPNEPNFSGDWRYCVPDNPGFPACPGVSFGTLSRNGDDWTYSGTGARGTFAVEISGRHIDLRGKRGVDGFQDYSLDLSEDGQTMEGTWRSVTNQGWAADCLQQACDSTQAFRLTRNSQAAAAAPQTTTEPKLAYDMAYVSRGDQKRRKGDLAGAIADFTSALEMNPKLDIAYIYRGDAKLKNKDYDGAIADYTNALELDPKSTLAYMRRGPAKFAHKDYDGAIADATELIGLDPKGFGYWDRAKAHREKGDHDGAIADYSRLIELDPGCWECYRYRGDAEFAKGIYDGAIADWEKTIEVRHADNSEYKAEIQPWIDQARAKLSQR